MSVESNFENSDALSYLKTLPNKSVKDKIKSLKKKLKQLEQEQEFLLNCDSGNKIYGKEDLEAYV